MKREGGLESIVETGKQLWWVWVSMAAVIGWGLRVDRGVENQVRLERKFDKFSEAVADDVLSRLPRMERFERDSLVSNSDFKFYFKQHGAEHRDMWRQIERANHTAVTHRDRPRYYPQYGPIPDKMTDWFEQYLDRGNE